MVKSCADEFWLNPCTGKESYPRLRRDFTDMLKKEAVRRQEERERHKQQGEEEEVTSTSSGTEITGNKP